MRTRRSFATAAGAGALFGLSFWPFPLGLLAWAAWVPLLDAIDGTSVRGAFARGWAFGTVAWAVGMYWFAGTIGRFAGYPAPAAGAVFLVICAYHGLMFGLVASAVAALGTPWASVPAAAFLDGFFPMLFPNHLANTQFFHLPMVQSAELFGTAGLAWLVAGSNAAVYCAWRRRKLAPLAVVGALILANEGYGLWRMGAIDRQVRSLVEEGRALDVALIQGAVPEESRFLASRFDENLEVYNGLTRRALASGKIDLVLWPQNVYERTIAFDSGDRLWSRPRVEGADLNDVLRRDLPSAAPLLLGAVAREGPATFYTGFVVEPARGIAGFVGKRDLTPLSEYLPLGRFFPRLYSFAPRGITWLTSGPHRLLEGAGAKLGVYLCYEALLPAGAREYALMGAELLVNLATDRFMGGIEPEQDLRLGALRAVENRRFLLRPASSGISAVIDPAGRILRRIPFEERGFVTARVALLRETTVHARTGPLFTHLALLALAALAWACARPRSGLHSSRR